MTTWQKLVLAILKCIAPLETVRDIALQYFNDFLARTNVAKNVSKTVKFIGVILPILEAAKGVCPDRWREEYNALVTTITFLRVTLEDGAVSPAEAQAAVEGVKIGIDKWINE